jgi:cation:H+ antiporter
VAESGALAVLSTIAMLMAGLVLLYLGGEWLVRGASTAALRLGLSPLMVGMTVVAFATSTPELAVSLDSAFAGVDDVAVGNVIGSNIANLGLVLGLSALIKPIRVQARMIRRDMPWLLLATLFAVWCLMDGLVGRVEGLMLLAGLVMFIGLNIRSAKTERVSVQEQFTHEVKERVSSLGRSWVMIAAGVIALVVGGAVFVEAAVHIAEATGVSTAVVGLTIAAIGTSLPELATAIVASARGSSDICAGNIVGSNFFNLLCILGLTAAIAPLQRGEVQMGDLYVMAGLTGLVLPFMYSGFRLGRREGALLLLCYSAYLGWMASRATLG